MPCTKCTKSYLDSYDVALDGVKKADPTISEHEARVKVAQLFRPKFHQWQEAAKIEMKGEREYQNGEFAFNDQREMYYPKTGETAEGLHVNQKRLSELPDHSSDEYSVEDHLITRLVQTTLREGATRVVTSYGCNDGKNRDVLEFNYDPISNKGFLRVLNTESNGHYRSFDEIKQIAKIKYSSLQETKITNNVFVLSDKPLEESKVRQTFVHLEQQIGHAMKETVITAGKNTLQEVKQTAISIEGHMRRKQDKRSKEIPVGDTFIRRVRRMFEHPTKEQGSIVFQRHPDQHKIVEKARVKKHDINLLSRSLERIKFTRQQVREKMATSVATLLFVRTTEVGIGGVTEMLRVMKKLPDISVESIKRPKKEKIRKQKITSETMRVFRKSEAFKKLTKREQRVLRRKEKVLMRKEKKLLLRKERRSIKKKEKILWNTLKRLVRRAERQFVSKKIKQKEKMQKINVVKKEIRTGITRKEHQTKNREKQHVVDFSVALVIWLLLHMQTSSHHHKEKKREVSLIKHKTSEKRIVQEPTPWLLFAIIWHLAMIREGGMRTAHRQKKAKKQVMQYYPMSMPTSGVIFAFAS